MLLLSLLALLSALDPLGSLNLAGLPMLETSIGSPACAQYRSGDNRIEFDSDCAQRNTIDVRWWACVLVHEAEHSRQAHNSRDTGRLGDERTPLMRQYICLDRLGAPAYMKDYLYGLMWIYR